MYPDNIYVNHHYHFNTVILQLSKRFSSLESQNCYVLEGFLWPFSEPLKNVMFITSLKWMFSMLNKVKTYQKNSTRQVGKNNNYSLLIVINYYFL